MNDLFDQIEAALNHRLYQLALFSTLTIPDICAAMDATDGEAKGSRYKTWFDRYVGPAYTHPVGPSGQMLQFLTGEDCWGLRCSMLHQGRAQPHQGQFNRILFVEPSNNTIHCNIVNDGLMVDIPIFCRDIVAGARQWLATVQGTPTYEKNYREYLNRYPQGFAPYLGGAPVIT